MTAAYRFERFELQPTRRQLLEGGRPVALGQRAFDVLLTLVERAGELVSKDELLDRVWPGVVVEENNLQVQVSALRKVLGSSAIATTASRGYRFTLDLARETVTPLPAATFRHNLPGQFTSFVGHEDDLVTCTTLLRESRLLTLTGIGGCGKSRLAIELAARMLPAFPDGVWYVDLAPVLEAERVALTVATTLDLREENDLPIVDTLCRLLEARRTLLIIDNCEHLVAACAALIQRLLAAAPALRVLAGSREGLGVRGERTITVRSLLFPAPGSKRTSAELGECEAVRLFVDRASHVVPKFLLRDDNAEAIGEICRRLDGIPLAIELAAARVKVLSVEEIRARLDDRFRLLTGSRHTAVGRQQTLLAAIQWSYDHLAPGERQLLRRLAVFVGGRTLDAAASIAHGAADEYGVLDPLTGLVDQSLVTTHCADDGATRYAMLESVRQYAHERLLEAGEDEATRDRHLAFFLALAERAAPELDGPEQAEWLRRLDVERENLLAAHAWCDHSDASAEAGLRLATALDSYFIEYGILGLGRRIVIEALARPDTEAPTAARGRTLGAAARLHYFMGHFAEAKEYGDASLTIARDLGDASWVAFILRYLGMTELAQGDLAQGNERLREALAIWRLLGAKAQIAKALNSIACQQASDNDIDGAERTFEEALTMDREAGNAACTAINLSNLAGISLRRGRRDRAHALIGEGIAIATRAGLKRACVALLENLVELIASCDDFEQMARFRGATQALSGTMNLQSDGTASDPLHSAIEKAQKNLGAETYKAMESAGRALSYEQAIVEAQAWLDRNR